MHLAVGRNSVDFIPFTYWSVEKREAWGASQEIKKGVQGIMGGGMGCR